MEIVETIALITINGTLAVQLLSFLLFLFLLNRIMIRPLHQIMLERRSLMDRITVDIASARESYQELCRQMQIQEDQARQSAFDIRNDIETSGKKAAGLLLQQTRTEIEAIRNRAQQESADQLAIARQTLQNEAVGIAGRMMEVLLGREIGSKP